MALTAGRHRSRMVASGRRIARGRKVRPMMDEDPRAGVIGGDGPRIQLQAVAPRVSAPMLHGDEGSSGRPARPKTADKALDASHRPRRTDATDDGQWHQSRPTDVEDDEVSVARAIELDSGSDDLAFETIRDRARLIVGVTAAVGILVAFSIAKGELRDVLAVGALVVGFAWLWTFDRHVSFSFGEGFLGYRAQMEWPRGVQEDDDVRWDWHSGIADRTLDVGRRRNSVSAR